MGDPPQDAVGVASGEVVGAEVVVVDVVGEDVPDRVQDRVLDGDDGSLFAAAGDDAPVARGQVPVFLASCAHGGQTQRATQCLVSLAGLAGFTDAT